MAWLWLISAGVSDVQFPVWKENESGQWTPFRVEIGRAGIRSIHEGLLRLLGKDRIEFPQDLPIEIGREQARNLRLVFEEDTGEFGASVASEKLGEAHQISQYGNELPNAHEHKLPLYFPKVQPLLPLARNLFGDEAPTVVVLNTRRGDAWRDSKNEPVGSGPLVAKFLAEALRLQWIDYQGRKPETLGANVSTWVDILIDAEVIEEKSAQDNIIKRLSAIIGAWQGGEPAEGSIAVTTTGGLPQLKPIIERVPGTSVGQDRVKLLQQEEFERKPTTTALDYQSRWTEREALRFHCAEALRKGDYVTAYGIANRYDLPWSAAVRNGLGPLLELPYHGAFLVSLAGAAAERKLKPHELPACQVEARLCGRDAVGAVVQLHVFLESAVWELIEANARLRELGLAADSESESLRGRWPGDKFDYLLKPREDRPDQYRLARLLSDGGWPACLTSTADEADASYCAAARSFEALCGLYNLDDDANKSIRRYRNRLVHGAGAEVDVSRLEDLLRRRGLANGIGQSFGENFLAVKSVRTLLANRGGSGLGEAVRQKLDRLLNTVIGS